MKPRLWVGLITISLKQTRGGALATKRIVLTLAQTRVGLSPTMRLFVATGILGGYTTLSAYAYETLLLARDANALQSLAYGLGSVAAGVAAGLLGIVLARAVFP